MSYASYTRSTSEPLKRIAHKRRFEQVVELIAAPLETDTVLDYGCGDGHLFSYFVGRIPRERLIGYDPNPKLLAEAAPDVATGARLTGDIEALKLENPFGFSLIYCMEVCEHLTAKAMAELFLNINAITAPHGRIVFGVPIETGPSGFFKNLYRVSKRIGYPVTVRNAFLSLVGAPIERKITDVEWFGHHTGFSHTAFRRILLDNGFKIRRTHHLPFPVLGGVLNNEIYFVCSK
jgi:SAM-dependent methyltransferase